MQLVMVYITPLPVAGGGKLVSQLVRLDGTKVCACVLKWTCTFGEILKAFYYYLLPI